MPTQIRSIGVIIGSTRQPRACPQIAQFVADTIKLQRSGKGPGDRGPELVMIDLRDWNLPMYDEPGIPSRIFDANEYKHEHTRAWSREIARHDAYIFVSPQYNWGYPASLKNAIDYLYNEWTGKGAMIVTYGGHGGSKCNAQLREVLEGLKMTVVSTSVELTFPSKEILYSAATGQYLALDAKDDKGTWNGERKTILAAYQELV